MIGQITLQLSLTNSGEWEVEPMFGAPGEGVLERVGKGKAGGAAVIMFDAGINADDACMKLAAKLMDAVSEPQAARAMPASSEDAGNV